MLNRDAFVNEVYIFYIFCTSVHNMDEGQCQFHFTFES